MSASNVPTVSCDTPDYVLGVEGGHMVRVDVGRYGPGTRLLTGSVNAASGAVTIETRTAAGVAVQSQVSGSGIASLAGFHLRPTPRWNAAYAKAVLGVGNARVLVIGDSTSMGAWATGVGLTGNALLGWNRRIAGKLAAPYTVASFLGESGSSIGLSGGAKDTTFKAYDTRITYDATWAIALGNCLGGYVIQSGGTDRGTFTFTPGVEFDRIDVFYTTALSAYASVTVDIGGAALATIVATGLPSGVAKTTVTCTLGTNAVRVTKSTDGFFQIRGIACYKNNTQIQLLQAGVSTMTAHNYMNGTTGVETVNGPSADLATVDADLTLIDLGINDSTFGYTTEAFTTKYQRIIDLANATGDVALVIPNAVSPAGNPDQDRFWLAVQGLADSNGLSLIDFRAATGDWATANTNGLMADGRHPLSVGYDVMANLLQRSGLLGR